MIEQELPEAYKGLISPQAYTYMLGLVLDILNTQGKVIALQDRTIHCQVEGQNSTHQLFLDNLVHICAQLDRSAISEEVKHYLQNFAPNQAALHYIFKDFEFAQHLLRLQIKPCSCLSAQALDHFIYQSDLPQTYTFLVLDFENRFYYLRQNEIKDWNQPISQLFKIAQENVAQESLFVGRLIWKERYPIFYLAENHYAAILTLHRLAKSEQFSGKYGTLLALPCRGQTFVYPIQDNALEEFIDHFDPILLDYYVSAAYPISSKLYWYYQGVYEIFQYEILPSQRVHIQMPPALIALLNNYI